jgi:ElaB/YqjD/DUF883 family membrane-anchored ribosome-binding protein
MATPPELNDPAQYGYDLPNGSDNGSGSAVAARLRERMGQARERVSDAMSVARDRSSQLRDRAADRIQSAPFASIALAVGVGVVIGWLLGRRD